jgi:TonB family protein
MSKRIFLLLTVFAALVASARDKPENWLEVRSPHFIVLSDSSEKRARQVTDQFERMRAVFQGRFPRASIDTGAPIVVLAIKDEKGFRTSDADKQEPQQADAGKPSADCARKATAAYGPVEVLTDTKGVDFSAYLQKVVSDVRKNWYNNIPESAKAPLMKTGKVIIEFAVLKDGTISGMKFISTSGDVALDRGAWAGVTASSPFSSFPSEFAGQYLGLRFAFYYTPPKLTLGKRRPFQLHRPILLQRLLLPRHV